MRAFVAIEPPETVRDACAQLSAMLKPNHHGIRWVPPENIHLTLRFLGEVNPAQIDAHASMMTEAATATPALSLAARGLGCFPNARKPSVVWVGVSCADQRLALLQARAEQAAQRSGLDAETQPFHPHLTLGRIRRPGPAIPLEETVQAHAAFEAGAWVVRDVALFASELHPAGVRYHRLVTIPLGTPP